MTAPRNLPNIYEVAIGALLHDIGKLLQRAHAGTAEMPEHVRKRESDILPSFKGRYTHWHALWTDVFFDWAESEGLGWPRGVDVRWVRDLAVYHHNPLQAYTRSPTLAATWLVTVADRVASGLDRKAKDEEAESETPGGRDAFRRTPIDAILSRLRLPGDGVRDMHKSTRVSARHIPAPLSPDAIIPAHAVSEDDVPKAYRDLWEAFREGWRTHVVRAGGDVHAFEEGLLSLSERLTWSVPSSTIDQPDVSLHDHARSVAAVAACLHAHHAERRELADVKAMQDDARPRLRFLVGDLSGLQATLFRLRSEQVNGLNRILRGRSQRFGLIADAAARRVCNAFGLPLSCVLQAAGGRFLVVLPALTEGPTKRVLEDIRREFDDWLAKQYSGQLGLGLGLSDPFATGDLIRRVHEEDARAARTRARDVWDALAIAGETAKLQQMFGPAKRGVVEQRFGEEGPCTACGVRPAQPGEVPRCPTCEAEHELGQRLPRAVAVTISESRQGDNILGLAYRVEVKPSEAGSALRGWRLEDLPGGPAPLRFGHPYLPRFPDALDRYTGIEEFEEISAGDLKTFEALGIDSREPLEDGRMVGRAMLAVLKADVDRLGLLFRDGFGEDETGLARRMALSRMLDAYFSGRLMALLGREFPNAYTVYAGGDDLFIVAPWRDALALALRLREDFDAFAGGNPDVTLSAGVALFDPRTPISIAAEEAEERLTEAKQAGRNRVSAIARTPLTWEEYRHALEAAERLNRWIRADRISDAALYRLLAFDDARGRIAAWIADREGPNPAPRPQDYAWKARFGYCLARMLPRRAHDPEQEEIARTLFGLFGLDQCFAEHRPAPGVRLAISHALYRNR